MHNHRCLVTRLSLSLQSVATVQSCIVGQEGVFRRDRSALLSPRSRVSKGESAAADSSRPVIAVVL